VTACTRHLFKTTRPPVSGTVRTDRAGTTVQIVRGVIKMPHGRRHRLISPPAQSGLVGRSMLSQDGM
jgi:hypothetical protein